MKKIIWFTIFIVFVMPVPAQDAPTNLLKYWKFRERLKNFVVVGDCQGCSLPGSRSDQKFNVHDETSLLGYYIGMLAMEYAVLTQKGYINPSQEPLSITIRDLYYAIEAVNRLDKNAEVWLTRSTHNPQLTSGGTAVLNGFFY